MLNKLNFAEQRYIQIEGEMNDPEIAANPTEFTKRIKEYKYEVNYSQMKQFETIGIICNNLVIRREDVEEYGIMIINDSRVHRIHDNCFRNNQEFTEVLLLNHIKKNQKCFHFQIVQI